MTRPRPPPLRRTTALPPPNVRGAGRRGEEGEGAGEGAAARSGGRAARARAAPPTVRVRPAWERRDGTRGAGGHGNPAFADARDAPDDDGLAARAGSAALGLFGAAKDAVSSYVEGPTGGFAGGRSYSSY